MLGYQPIHILQILWANETGKRTESNETIGNHLANYSSKESGLDSRLQLYLKVNRGIFYESATLIHLIMKTICFLVLVIPIMKQSQLCLDSFMI